VSGETYPHLPVLYQEIIHALQPAASGKYIDGTVGLGGHAEGILHACSPDGQLLGIDLDAEALLIARQRLEQFHSRLHLMRGSYAQMDQFLARLGWTSVQGILLDLGASSLQFDSAHRGFSFQMDGALDMRFDPSQGESASILINHISEDELERILRDFGEERHSRNIARAIISNRPFYSTKRLADLVASQSKSRVKGIHPATRTFQAIRIAVNGELDNLQNVLPVSVNHLVRGGRLAIISFHSLEDRIVKHYFARESRDCICPTQIPVCVCGHKASIRLVNRHPMIASEDEVKNNPRSRSAKLRIVEKL
jgi:16S rRNA (cytosine1402-N4)-methyltransferase